MLAVQQTALQAILQRLARVPQTAKPLRAVLLYTCARWHKLAGDDEQAIAELDGALELLPQLRPALQLMSRLQLGRGDFRSAVVYLDEEIRCTRHAADACALYRERGRLLQQYYHDPAPTEQCYRAALDAVDGDWPALRSLTQHAIATAPATRIDALLAQRAHVDDPAVAACLLRELAGMYTRRAQDLPTAATYLLEALTMSPGHASLLADITRVADQLGDPDLMLAALEQSTVPTGPVTTQALARLFLLLRDQTDAESLELRAAYPRHRHNVLTGWLGYAEAARSLGRVDQAAAAMSGALRALGHDDPPSRARILYRLAHVLVTDAQRGDDAVRLLRRALQHDPDHVPARVMLLELGRNLIDSNSRASDHARIATHLESIEGDEEEIADHYLQAAVARLDDTDPSHARRYLDAALRVDPTYRPARDAYDHVLTATRDHIALTQHLEGELSLSETDSRQLVILARLARLDLVGGDPARSVTRLGQLVKLDRAHAPSLQCAAWIMARSGGHDDARLRVLAQEFACSDSATRRSHLAGRAATLSADQDDDEAAATWWARALEQVDDGLDALAALERHAEVRGDTARRLTLLSQRLLYTPCRNTQTYCRLERAIVLLERGESASEALAEVEQALAQDPINPVALYLAQHLTAEARAWTRHHELVSARASLASKSRAKSVLELELAQTCLYGLGRDQEATLRFEAAFGFDSSSALARQRVAERYARHENWSGLAETAIGDDGPALAPVWSLLADRMGLAPDTAHAWRLAATRSEPNDTLLALAALTSARAVSDHTALVEICNRLATRFAGDEAAASECFAIELLAAWAQHVVSPHVAPDDTRCDHSPADGLHRTAWLRLLQTASDDTDFETRLADAATRSRSDQAQFPAEPYLELGLSCERRGHHVDASAAYHAALEVAPTHTLACLLACTAPAPVPGLAGTARRRFADQTQVPHLRAALLSWHAHQQAGEASLSASSEAMRLDPEPSSVQWVHAMRSGAFDDAAAATTAYAGLAASTQEPVAATMFAVASIVAAGFAGDAPPAAAARRLADPANDILLYDVLPALAASPRHLDATLDAVFPDNPDRVIELTRNVEQALEAASQSIVIRERLARRRPIEGADARSLADLEADLRYVRLNAGSHVWAHRRLAALYRWRGDSAPLVDTLRSLASQLAGAEASIVYDELARLLIKGRAKTPAVAALERAVSLCADDLALASRLAAAYVEQGRIADAAAVLDRYADQADDEHMQAAALREATWIELCGLAPSDGPDGVPSMAELTRLDRLTALDPSDWASGYAFLDVARRTANVGLAEGDSESGQDQAVRILALSRLIDHVRDATSLAPLLVEYGTLVIDSERDPDAGSRALRRALEVAPGYAPALRRLDAYYLARDEHAACLELCSPEVDPVSDPASVAMRAAMLARDRLGDAVAYLHYLGLAYEAAPDNRGCRHELVGALASHGHIERAYAIATAHDPPPGPAAAAHHEYTLGTYAAALSHQPEIGWHYATNALDHFRAALEHQPDHDLAFIAAERLCLRYGDIDNLAGLLRSQLASRRGPSHIVALTRLARLLTDVEGHVDDVRAAYERAHKLSPDDTLLLFEFEHWARRMGDHALTADLLHERARRTSDPRYAAALYIEAAEHWSEGNDLPSASRSATAILEALRATPGDPHASRHLDRILADGVADIDVTRALDARTTLRARSPAEQAIFCLESGELLERAGALEDARRAYTAAQTALPGLFVAEMGLRRLDGEMPSQPTATESPRNPTAVDDASLHELMERAREAFMHLPQHALPAQAEAALSPLRTVLASEPNHPDALALTRAVSQRLADASPAMQILAEVFARLDDDPVRHDIAVMLAENLGPVPSAVEYLRAALEAQPESTRALLALVQCYQRLGQTDAAIEAAERMLRLLDPDDALAVDDRLALARQLGETPTTRALAFVHVDQLLDARPGDQRCVSLKAELCELDGRLDEAATLYEKLATKIREPARLHDVLVRSVRLLLRAGQVDERTRLAIERAIELQPGNAATIELLVLVLERTEQEPRLGTFLPQIHAALLDNIARGSVSATEIALLERVASPVDITLARAAAHAHFAFDPSRSPPSGSGRVAVAKRLRRLLTGNAFESRLLATGEPAPLSRLLAAADAVLEHVKAEFPVLSTDDATAVPTTAIPSRIQSVVNAWLEAAGMPRLTLLACETPHTAIILPGDPSAIHISRELWLAGEATAWRGLSALAIARWLVAPFGIRALPPSDMISMLAACFAWVDSGHSIRDPGKSEYIDHLVAQLDKHVPRRRKRAVATACEGARNVPVSATALARGMLATDLRLATLLTGRIGDCLAAASLLDGHSEGPLLQRVRLSRNARDLLTYCLRADMVELREQLLDDA